MPLRFCVLVGMCSLHFVSFLYVTQNNPLHFLLLQRHMSQFIWGLHPCITTRAGYISASEAARTNFQYINCAWQRWLMAGMPTAGGTIFNVDWFLSHYSSNARKTTYCMLKAKIFTLMRITPSLPFTIMMSSFKTGKKKSIKLPGCLSGSQMGPQE